MNDAPLNSSTPKTFYQRWSVAVIGATLCLSPLVFYWAALAVQSNVNRVEDWLPKTFEETKHLAWFREHFPSDQFVIVSWRGCRLDVGQVTNDETNRVSPADDPRLARLARMLVPEKNRGEREDSLDQVNSQAPGSSADEVSREDAALCSKYFNSVMTGRDLLDQLTAPPLSLSVEAAVERLQGTMIGPDGAQTCLIVTLRTAALSELKQVLGTGQNRILRADVPAGILRRMIEKAGVAAEDVHLGGPPVDNNAINEEGERTLVRLAGLSGLLGLGLAWWSLRSIPLTLIVFFCGVMSAASSLAIVGISGQNVDAILMSMPSLVYVLAISGAVHLVNYYREAVESGGLYAAVERAVKYAWKPAMLCSVTTAVGLVSLSASELVPIRKFGIFSAAGVMSLVGIVYFFLPAALQVSGIGKRWLVPKSATPLNSSSKKNGKLRKHQATVGSVESAALQASSNYRNQWEHLASSIVAHYRGVGLVCAIVTVVVGYGLKYSSSSIDLLKLFDHRARILQDYRWLEANLGKLVPLEIVVRFPAATQRETWNGQGQQSNWSALSFVQRLETITRMQTLIKRKFGPTGDDVVGNSMSAASFVPDLPPSASGNYSFVHRKILDARLSRSKQELSDAGFLCIDKEDGSELWRISLRVAAFRDVDYGKFVKDLEQITQPLLAAYHARADILSNLSRLSPKGTFAGKHVLLWSCVREPQPEQAAQQAFVLVLHRLLQEYRCDVKLITSDPLATPLTELEELDRLGAVVACGDFSDADLAVVQAAIPDTIDARLSVGEIAPLRVASVELETAPTAEETERNQSLSAVYTGVVPIVYQAQRALLNSLVESTWWSFLTITPIIMIVSRSILAGAIAMIPNAIPVLFIFGAMGWLNIPIDIGSMMTASIALGVAVDDTIHFLARYREELAYTPDRERAIIGTYGHCAVPTLQAALISGLGLSVFAFSTFTPTQRFGWLMLSILLAGVVSELIVLPALLASPLGIVFGRNKSIVVDKSIAVDAASTSEQPAMPLHAQQRPAA
ncbi:MAG: MMPL family transporter [Planctomycetales bacterium]|nr:MMPL family transporter [Planctomycetales bacterium]